MRSSLLIVTLASLTFLVAQRSVNAQYSWAGDYPAGVQQAMPGASTDYTAYASYLGDLQTDKMAHDVKAGCGPKCDCLACQRNFYASRSFASLEFMHWWNKGRDLPPLVTTSPAGTAQDQAGVLGDPSTTILLGNDDLGANRQAAGRLTFGFWLDECKSIAVGAKVFGVEGHDSGYFASSNGIPILARPFFNDDPLVDAEDSFLIAYPGLSQGNVDIWAENEVFGSEAFLRYLIDRGCNYRIDVLGGYHFTRINDDLRIRSLVDDGATLFELQDLFETSNEFHAGEVGIMTEIYHSRWTFSGLAKVSFGNMQQRVSITGHNTITAGGSVTVPGGLLAQPTNIGVFEDNVNVWLPEGNLKLSYAVNDQLSLSVGYTILYWSNVLLAADQIDNNVNASQIGGGMLFGPPTPTFVRRDTEFWMQSVDIGVSWNY